VDSAGGPVDNEGFPLQVLRGDEAPVAAVLAVSAVISQDEIGFLRHPDLLGAVVADSVVGIGYDGRRVAYRFTVYQNMSLSDLYCFPGQTDDSLYEVLLLVLGIYENLYTNLLTKILSPICSVGNIEELGISKALPMKVSTIRARTSADIRDSAYSLTVDFFLSAMSSTC
jgi:hypothetical protein